LEKEPVAGRGEFEKYVSHGDRAKKFEDIRTSKNWGQVRRQVKKWAGDRPKKRRWGQVQSSRSKNWGKVLG
jgi:hypothetical protein